MTERFLTMVRDLEIWSGGQTGVDRAALDAALESGLPYGGWVPLGRLAEDGIIPARYEKLREANSDEYAVRTLLNVQDTDATLIIRWGSGTGGTLYTIEEARRLGRPILEIDLADTNPVSAVAKIGSWLDQLPTRIRLNVAGPRASQAPDAYERARDILTLTFRLITPP